MTLASVMVVVSAFAGSAATARAQQHTQIPGPLVEQRSQELAQWLKDYRAWEKWFEHWGNKVAQDFNGHVIDKRKERPEPPAWLLQTGRVGSRARDPNADAGGWYGVWLTRSRQDASHQASRFKRELAPV